MSETAKLSFGLGKVWKKTRVGIFAGNILDLKSFSSMIHLTVKNSRVNMGIIFF